MLKSVVKFITNIVGIINRDIIIDGYLWSIIIDSFLKLNSKILKVDVNTVLSERVSTKKNFLTLFDVLLDVDLYYYIFLLIINTFTYNRPYIFKIEIIAKNLDF